MSSLSEKLRFVREQSGLTQSQVAELSGIGYKTINNYETGTSKPDVEKLATLCNIYKVSADVFMETYTKTSNNSMTPREIKLLQKYRKLNEHGKEITEQIMEIELKWLENLNTKDTAPDTLNHLEDTEILEDTTDDIPSHYPLTYFDDLPVSAGTGFYSMDIANSITVELRTPPPKGASYMVKVTGDSMHPTIKDGDKIFIKNDKCVKVGEIGIFILNSDFYIKELGEGRLLSHNPNFPPIPIREGDNIVCRGKFIGICKEDFK